MSSFDFNYLLRSLSGKIKLASAGVGLLAMAFCAGAFDYHHKGSIAVVETSCALREARAAGAIAGLGPGYRRSVEVDKKDGYFSCGRIGFAQAGLAFVIIAWLFSVVIVIISAMPSMIEQPLFRKIDAFGHIGAGAVDILGFFLVIIYTYNIHAALSAYYGCDNENVTDEEKSICNKMFIWEYTFEGCRDLICIRGFRMIIWIFGALLALAHGIVCIVIFMLVKKAQGQTGPMMMVNQTGSQVPPTGYPSQAGSQQQAPPPEQQPSGHHSKHSQKV